MAVAANALTTLVIVNDELGLTSDSGPIDARIERYINAVSDRIENYCNRSFFQEAGKVEKIEGFPSAFLVVSKTPLTVITSITFDGSTIDSTNYELHGDGKEGKIYRVGGWIWTASVRQDITRTVIPGSERRLYTVTYTGGFATIPKDLEDVATEMVTDRFNRKGRSSNVKAETLGPFSQNFGGQVIGPEALSGIPAHLRATLDGYKELAMA